MDISTHLTRWHGATTTALLRDDGFTERDVRRFLADGLLERVRRGAFIQPAVHEMRLARTSVAIARTLPGTALTHASAVAAWGLPVLDSDTHRVALAREGAGHAHSASGSPTILRELRAPTRPLASWPDVPAVVPEFAILQLAHRHGAAALAAANAATHQGCLVLKQLATAEAAMRDEFGASHRRRLVAHTDDRIESVGETLSWLALTGLGLDVTPQVQIYDHDGFAGRVDFLDEARGVIYEFDGDVKYESKQDVIREKRREDRLRRLGFGMVRLTWAHVRTPATMASLLDHRPHFLRRDVVLRHTPRQETPETDTYA